MYNRLSNKNGFSLVELVLVLTIIGILVAVAIPRFIDVRDKAEHASVDTMVSSLESALAIHSARKFVNQQRPSVHNPFEDLTNKPRNYNGVFDPINSQNTPPGTWSFRSERNWVVYNPQLPIRGGWENNGTRYIIFQVEVVIENLDTVGMNLTTTSLYRYQWN